MLDSYYQILNHENLIEENLPKIIEAFVNYYGEDKRDYITNRFMNTTYITYVDIDGLKTVIRTMKEIKTSELLNRIKEKVNGLFSEDEFNKLFYKYGKYDEYLIHEYYECINKIKNGEHIVEISSNLRNFDENITIENIKNCNFDEKMQKLNSIKSFFDELTIEYNEFLISIEKEESTIKKLYQLEEKLEKEAGIQFIHEFKDYLEVEEYNKIIEFYNAFGSINTNLSPNLQLMLNSGINSQSLIEFFSEEADEKLVSGAEFEKNQIIQNRISYFKKIGIDLGTDYNAYINDTECQKLIPDKLLVHRIIEFKSKAKQEIKKKINQNYNNFIFNSNKFNIDNSLYLEQSLDDFYENETTCVVSDIIKNGNAAINKPIVFINAGADLQILDANIIHEFNHLYELVYNYQNDMLNAVIGWDIVNGKFDYTKEKYVDIETTNQHRKYELFNEIINDLISQEIGKNMHAKGNYVITEPEVARFGSNGYRPLKFLVTDFLSMYKDIIIQSRSNNQMELIYEKVGKENFEELNSLIQEFQINLGGVTIYQLFKDLDEGKDTDLTRKYNEIIEKRNIILQNMMNYSYESSEKNRKF